MGARLRGNRWRSCGSDPGRGPPVCPSPTWAWALGESSRWRKPFRAPVVRTEGVRIHPHSEREAAGQQPEPTALWPPAPASSSAADVHRGVEPAVQPGPTCPLTGGGGGGGGRVVPDREQPGASAEPRSPPESAHPLPPLAESIPRLCSPHLGRGLWLWLRFSDAETETQGDRAAVRWGPGWGGGVGAPPRPPLLHVGWGQVWNFLLLFTFEWCRRPGGARLGSLSGSSTPSTPGIFIPV